MSRLLAALAAVFTILGAAQPAAAQEFSALARVVPGASALRADGAGVALDLAISQPVPWRVRLLADPARAVLDFREVDFSGMDPEALGQAGAVRALRFGSLQPGW